MKNNFLICYLFWTFLNIYSSVFAGDVTSEPLYYLFNEKAHIASIAVTCSTKIRNKIVNSTPKGNYLLKKMEHKSFQEWQEKRDSLYMAFLSICDQQTRSVARCNDFKSIYNVIRDTILVRCLLQTFGAFPKSHDWELIYCVKTIPYPYLNKYRDIILQRIAVLGEDGMERFANVYPLFSTTDSIRKKLLENKKLQPALRARIGDKKAEEQIISKAKQYHGHSIQNLAEQLFLCGTRECLQEALVLFTKPIYHVDTGHCGVEIERIFIIRGFRYYHPELSLLFYEYDNTRFRFIRRDPRTEDKSEEIREYIIKFTDWGQKEYNVPLKMNDYFLFDQQCDSTCIKNKINDK